MDVGLLRQITLAAETEALLVKHGDHLAQIRFDLKDHMNQVYIPAGEFTMGSGAKDKEIYGAQGLFGRVLDGSNRCDQCDVCSLREGWHLHASRAL